MSREERAIKANEIKSAIRPHVHHLDARGRRLRIIIKVHWYQLRDSPEAVLIVVEAKKLGNNDKTPYREPKSKS